MRRVLNFDQYVSLNESGETSTRKVPRKHFILDGASSAGKSSALKNLDDSWCVLAVDSFYNVMFEEIGNEDFGNTGKPGISEIYPGCPYGYSKPDDPNWEKAARWYMAQEAMYGKIMQEGLKDATGNTFGKPADRDKVIYDDVEGTIMDMFVAGDRPKWLLVHAPIDHTIANVKRRGDRPLDGVLKNSYCFKYMALPEPGGIDPEKSWTAEEIEEMLPKAAWVKEFLYNLGIEKDGKKYWIYPKKQPQGEYDVVINTRDGKGDQKTIGEIAKEAKQKFEM
jgi:hypothetical protein